MNDELKEVFSGSEAEAEYISEILKDNGIDNVVSDSRNDLFKRPWHGDLYSGVVSIFVAEDMIEDAKVIVEDINNAAPESSDDEA